MKLSAAGIAVLAVLFSPLDFAQAAEQGPNPDQISILHTNDLHSHFRSEKGPLGLGGVARIKTLVQRIRDEQPQTLFVDGGDWSEGDVYYKLGAGIETLNMMNHLSYDVAVVGNHDWLNGPGVLLDAYLASSASLSLVATNVSVEEYEDKDEAERFQELIPQYVIRDVGGVSIAFLGIVTFEMIYDKFFEPVEILPPFRMINHFANQLKEEHKVDFVIGISHNNIKMNKGILKAAPNLDFVVGAHDHKLIRPDSEGKSSVVVTEKRSKPGWVVEAGAWGRYVGRVDLKVSRDSSGNVTGVDLDRYRVYQIDEKIPENPATLARISRLEAQIEQTDGPIFHDHVGYTHIEVNRKGNHNLMGSLVTDAYRAETDSDIAIDNYGFIYQGLHKGCLRSVDIYNALPGVYDAQTGKTWTLKKFKMKGSSIVGVFSLLFSNESLSQRGVLSTSGLDMIYNPFAEDEQSSQMEQVPTLEQYEIFPFSAFAPLFKSLHLFGDTSSIIRKVFIGGEELDVDREYVVTVNQGVVEAIEMLNKFFKDIVPLDTLQDTQIEAWTVLRDYISGLKEIKKSSIDQSNRIRSEQSDLGVYYNDLRWKVLGQTKNGVKARIWVNVSNRGATASSGDERVYLYGNLNGSDTTQEPRLVSLGEAQPVPPLEPGQTQVFRWDAVVPGDSGVFPVTAKLYELKGEVNHANDEVTHWFTTKKVKNPNQCP